MKSKVLKFIDKDLCMLKYIFAVSVASVFCSSAYAQVTDKTVQGKLSIKENILYLNGKEIKPKIEGDFSLSIEKNVNYKNGNAVLLMNNSGGTACPVQYRWLVVLPDSTKQTPEFGTCSDIPKVTIDGDKLTVIFPKFNSAPKATIVFDGNSITENGKPKK